MILTDKLKNKIAWKIYVIWFFRRILPLILLQLFILALALRIFAKNVFVAMVIKNLGQVAEAGYWQVFKYMAASFLNTRPINQIVILVLLGIFALILRDIGRSLLAYKSTVKK